MCRLVDSRVIAPTISARRLLARVVTERCQRYGLLAFNAADTHLHLEVVCSGISPRELARRLEISLKQRLKLQVGFSPAHVRPILDQHHLYRCFGYVFRQGVKHGLDWDPYLEASNLPDLLGLRVLSQITTARVRQQLPRVKRAELLGYLGVAELEPADAPLDLLMEAAQAVVARDSLDGHLPELLQVRRAIAALAGERLTATQLAGLLGASRRSVTRLRSQPHDQRYSLALRLQLALRRSGGQPAQSG